MRPELALSADVEANLNVNKYTLDFATTRFILRNRQELRYI